MDKLLDKAIPYMVIGVIFMTLLAAPLGLYAEGSAKSRWLKETKGMDIPWYEAYFLETGNQDINLKID